MNKIIELEERGRFFGRQSRFELASASIRFRNVISSGRERSLDRKSLALALLSSLFQMELDKHKLFRGITIRRLFHPGEHESTLCPGTPREPVAPVPRSKFAVSSSPGGLERNYPFLL